MPLRNLKLCLYFSLIQETVITPFRPRYGPVVDLVSDRNGYQEYFLGGKCCRWLWPITLPAWCADCLEFWELHSHATLWEWKGLNKDCFIFTFEPSPISEAISRWAFKDMTALMKSEYSTYLQQGCSNPYIFQTNPFHQTLFCTTNAHNVKNLELLKHY